MFRLDRRLFCRVEADPRAGDADVQHRKRGLTRAGEERRSLGRSEQSYPDVAAPGTRRFHIAAQCTGQGSRLLEDRGDDLRTSGLAQLGHLPTIETRGRHGSGGATRAEFVHETFVRRSERTH